jgi:hypothetical protein
MPALYPQTIANPCQHISYWVTQAHIFLLSSTRQKGADLFLPACLFNAGYLAFVGQLAEAKPAYLEFAIYGVRPAAKLATCVLPYSELLFLLNLVLKGLG